MQTFHATVTQVIQETHDTTTLHLELDKPIEYTPGQFISFVIDKDGKTYRRPYSIATPQNDKLLAVTIKKYEDGAISPVLCAANPNDTFTILGPFGRFTQEESPTPVLLLGAGSGIVPLMCMLRNNKEKPFTLIYSNKTTQDIIYKDELNKLEQQEWFTHIKTLTQEQAEGYQQGRITEDLIKDIPLREMEVYICGPPAFCADMRAITKNAALVKSEEYD